MSSSTRLQDMQDDLNRTASELEKLSRALEGHARYLQHTVHRDDAAPVRNCQEGLQTWATELRELARGMEPKD